MFLDLGYLFVWAYAAAIVFIFLLIAYLGVMLFLIKREEQTFSSRDIQCLVRNFLRTSPRERSAEEIARGLWDDPSGKQKIRRLAHQRVVSRALEDLVEEGAVIAVSRKDWLLSTYRRAP